MVVSERFEFERKQNVHKSLSLAERVSIAGHTSASQIQFHHTYFVSVAIPIVHYHHSPSSSTSDTIMLRP